MASIEFVWDTRSLESWNGVLVEKAIVRAMSRAGGDAIRAMKTGSSKGVRQRKRFKVKRVNLGLPIFFPTRKQSLQDLVWRMDVSGKAMPVFDFPHRQTARGVSIAVNQGQRTLVTSAFVAKMKSGHKGVFLRKLSGKQGPITKKMAKRGQKFRVGRLPIQEAFSTRISDVFGDRDFVPMIQLRGQSTFASSVDRLLKLELDKLSK